MRVPPICDDVRDSERCATIGWVDHTSDSVRAFSTHAAVHAV